jgi:hypothetical protein
VTSDQSRTIGLGALLALLVVAKMTGSLDWLRSIFTYEPYTWQLNPLSDLSISTPFGSIGGGGGGSGGGGGGGGSKGSGSSSTDSGTHQAMDAQGNVYTVNNTYGGSSAQQQDDENRFAHQVGNG